MARRKIPGIRTLSVKEVRELSKLPWVRDEALSARHLRGAGPAGRPRAPVTSPARRAALYPSREPFAKMKREGEAAAAKGPVDLTRDAPPADRGLPARRRGARTSLGKVLRVPDEALDSASRASTPSTRPLKLRRAKRLTPEVFTPLVAYVGEVMRLICDGRWMEMPATWTRREPIFDPAELAAWQALTTAGQQSTREAEENARARGASAKAVAEARQKASLAATNASFQAHPKPIGFKEVEERIHGQENEPIITARDGRSFQPFALVVVPMVEPSKRLALRAAVGVMLMPYRPGYKAGPPGALTNPVARPTPPAPDPSKAT